MKTEDEKKVEAYFDIIENHVINFIQSSCLNESCITTLLLIFASVDSLGKLIHPNPDAKSGERFKYIISKFGTLYDQRKDKIWALRNSLAHNALNVAVFLSRTQIGEEHHLEDVSAPGKIYINTKLFFKDFLNFYNSEKARILSDASNLTQAASRLAWHHDDGIYALNYPTTPPPPVMFIGTI
jgi:hypothetical protein